MSSKYLVCVLCFELLNPLTVYLFSVSIYKGCITSIIQSVEAETVNNWIREKHDLRGIDLYIDCYCGANVGVWTLIVFVVANTTVIIYQWGECPGRLGENRHTIAEMNA